MEVVRWDGGVRATPWAREPSSLPDVFTEYSQAAATLPRQAALLDEPADGELPVLLTPLASDGCAIV